MSLSPRKLIVMFADVSGSTALFEKLGDREAMHAVERCLKRMNRSIDGYTGKTIQIVGDELLASFENAEEACQAAIDMQQRIADLPPDYVQWLLRQDDLDPYLRKALENSAITAL